MDRRLNQFDQQVQALNQEVRSLKQQRQDLTTIVAPLPNDLAIVLESFLTRLQQALTGDAP